MRTKVLCWGTGNVGYHALRSVIRHPKLELVGLHAHSETKLGKDAMEIAGLSGESGILASKDVDHLIAQKPDVAVYTASGETRPFEAVADMVALLEAGINVVGTALIFLIFPAQANANLREPLEAACKAGNSTLFINGMDPGFSGDVLPLAALQLSDQVQEIRVQEICDYSSYPDPDFTGATFGFGQPPESEPLMSLPGVLSGSWGGMLHLVAKAIGVEIESIEEHYERDYAKSSFDCTMMHVPEGTCSAVHFELKGLVDGKPLIVAEHVNRLGDNEAPHWPKAPEGRLGVHRVIVTGNPSIQLECFLKGEDGDHNTGGVQATGLRLINAIPQVIAHAPGLVSTLDLPYSPATHLAS